MILQYSQIVGCLKGLKRLQKSQQYQKFRPSCPIKGNARLWWQYAFHCCQYSRNGDMIVTKTWQQCLDRGRDNVKYVEVYCKILNAQPGYVNLTVEERRLKEEMEMERGYEELKTLREAAMFRLRPPPPPSSAVPPPIGPVEARSVLAGWLPAWTWYATPPPTSSDPTSQPNQPPLSLSEAEREVLEDEIRDGSC
ncbi:vacuolar protein sorting-associated protein 13D-like [Diaphorina citri]|uniref:Vacuolar protein sorting-associated protein 13D-like n=1 Tax=Diaphorina citri TaxID=121845 RepID=A0A3Q0JHS7_DIACI|nr:vacuolar protein sorting-associated protein 13D-like [Diaphorina citri]